MKNFTQHLFMLICCSGIVGTLQANTPVSATQQDPAVPCYGTSIVEFNQGLNSNGQAVAANRSITDNALGAPDQSNAANGFLSLGLGGHVVIAFGGDVYDLPGNDIMIYESSFSGDTCGLSDDEKALIELTQDGVTWVTYGEICRDAAIDIAGLGLEYVTQIKITDIATSLSRDGYDVDGVVAVNGCEDPALRRCYGSEVVLNSYMPGPQKNGSAITNPNRTNPAKALGAPQDDNTENFVSLGYGGQVTISFSGVVQNNPGDDLRVVETTFGNGTFSSYPESADVLVSQNGVDFYFIGSAVTNGTNSFDISNAPLSLSYIKEVRIIDTTPTGSISDDGFDLDGIVSMQGCSEAPMVNYAGCSATEVLEYVQGTQKNGSAIASIRTDANNALGFPEGTDENVFTTLGYGGSITVAFNGAVKNEAGPDLVFIETSFNQALGCEQYREYADIYVSFDNYSWHFAGTVCKSNNAIDISDAGAFEYINFVKVVNNDALSTTNDAYDLDGIIAIYTCEDINASSFLLNMTDITSREVEFSTYPNPTTGISNIKFNAPASGKMTIEAYDLLGRNVATVFNNDVTASQNYTVSFDGSKLPNGMYLYKITLDGNTSVKKFMIAH